MVSFLDTHSTTDYSSRALNAAMAVLSTAGPDAFLKFHEHRLREPARGGDGGRARLDPDRLGRPGRRRQRPTVTPLINDNVYHQWVVNATDQMSKDGVNGTPTVFINGKSQGADPQAAAQNRPGDR